MPSSMILRHTQQWQQESAYAAGSYVFGLISTGLSCAEGRRRISQVPDRTREWTSAILAMSNEFYECRRRRENMLSATCVHDTFCSELAERFREIRARVASQ